MKDGHKRGIFQRNGNILFHSYDRSGSNSVFGRDCMLSIRDPFLPYPFLNWLLNEFKLFITFAGSKDINIVFFVVFVLLDFYQYFYQYTFGMTHQFLEEAAS